MLASRILVLKSLASSKLLYACTMKVPSKFVIDQLNTWNNKRPKIKHSTLIADYCEGGYKNANIKNKIAALKCLCIEMFDHFFYWLMRKTVKNREEGFLPFVNVCFCSRDMRFQSHGNLEKNAKRKLSILCPYNKNCDVTSMTCIYSIFKSYVIQTSLVIYQTRKGDHENISVFVAIAIC